MKKVLVVSGLVVTLLLGVTYAFARGPGYGPGHGPGYGPCPRGEAWHGGWGPGKGGDPGKWQSLTPEQKTKFQELRRKSNEETAQLRGSLVTKRLELQSLWTNPKADSKAILDKEKELRDLQNQMRDKMVQFRLEARNILTPEQLADFGPPWGMGQGPRMGGWQGMGRGCGMWR